MRDKYRAAVPVAGQVRQIRTTLVPVIFSVAALAFISFAAAEEGDMTAPAEPPAVTSAEAKPGAADDLFRKGLAAKDRDDYREATRWWREAAELGEIRAMLQLAWVYSRGASGISRDHPESAKWYRKAAERGNPAAQHSLGALYRDGQGVPRDYEQAMLWFQRAAKQGNTSAQSDIGWLYKNGWGVPRDYGEAMEWYRKAAERGNPSAQNRIGLLYYYGQGVERDYRQAMQWFQKAASQDYPAALFNIITGTVRASSRTM